MDKARNDDIEEDQYSNVTPIIKEYGSTKVVEIEYQNSPKTNVSYLLRPDDGEENETSENKETVFIYLCALSADLLSFSSGISLSWTSPILPKLDTDENPFGYQVSTTQKAWIAALLPLGAAIGPLLAGFCVDRFGRKKTLLGIAVPMILGYLVLAGASHVEMYYFARFIIGLGVGSNFAVVPIYNGEITQHFNRGKFGCIMGLSMVMGLFYPFSIGPYLSIKMYAITSAIPLVVFILVFSIFMPESPYYLIKTGNYYLADSVLRKLRPVGYLVHKELSQINDTVKKSLENKGTVKELFSNKVIRRTLFISLGIVLLQQLAGINPLLSYMKTIFEASGSTIDPNICTLIIGTVEVSSNVLCIAVVEKFGRRTLLMLSSLGCSIAIFALGVFFYLKLNGFNVDPVFWLPVTCLVCYNILFSLGLGPLPWTVVGELFATNIKGIAAAFCASSNFLISSLVTFLFPLLSEYIEMYGVFWIFSFNCILGLIFIYFVLPETKGKSLGDIQRILLRLVD